MIWFLPKSPNSSFTILPLRLQAEILSGPQASYFLSGFLPFLNILCPALETLANLSLSLYGKVFLVQDPKP